MLIVQYNCRQEYKNIIIAMEIILNIIASIVILQKLFMSNQKIFYCEFKFYLLQKEKKISE